MNKVHKTVWNQASGQWVVVSELVKGHRKSKSAVSILALSALALLPSTVAWAATPAGICTTVGAVSTCDGANTTINAPIIEVSGAGATGPKTLNVSNVTINGDAATLPIDWPSMISMAGNNGGITPQDYGSVTLNVDNVTMTKTGASVNTSGLYLRTDTTDATGTITSNAQITLTGTAGRTEGILLESFNGYSSLHLQAGSGTSSQILVNSTSGNGAGARVVGVKGVSITTDVGTSIQVIGSTSTSGGKIYGIHVGSGSAQAVINNGGTIQTNGYNGHAILIESPKAEITNTGNITISGPNSYGIYTNQQTGTSSESWISNSADIVTTSFESDGIRIDQAGSVTNTATVINSGKITTSGLVSFGIDVSQMVSTASGSITVQNQGDIKTTGGGNAYGIGVNQSVDNGTMGVTNNAQVETQGSYSYGIYARQTNAADSAVTVMNNDEINTLGTGAHAVYIYQRDNANSTIDVTSSSTGVIETQGNEAHGIFADARSSGLTQVSNAGQITTTGSTSRGIYVSASPLSGTGGAVEVSNTGSIQTDGADADGIRVNSVGTDELKVLQGATGNITTLDARGIHVTADTGDVLVTASGNITTGQATATTHNHGIDAGSNSGKTEVEFSNGTIKVVGTNTGGGNAIGIAAWDRGSTNSSVQAYINLGSGAIVDATEGVLGLQIRSNGTGQIDIASGAQVHGGLLGGVQLTGTGTGIGTYTLNNAGEIDAMSDLAVLSSAPAGSTLSITNDGTITGYLRGGAEDTTFTNNSSNSWNLRNFADTDGDGVRDTKAVAVSDFGAGNDTYINTATGTLRLAAVSGETTTVTTGEYIPAGALSSSNAGIVHGQLLNLNRFENAGTIDLSANGLAGDVLVITGGTTPGTDGGGLYISNGGSLIVDTHLNEGGVNSLSDVLVVDNVQMGSGATRIIVNPMIGSTGGLTIDDGIKIVEVMGTQDAGSFVLDAPVTYGAFEYILVQGTLPGNESHWHLQNYDTTSSNNNWWWDWANRALWNPNIGSYLGNQYAAATMFNQNILDRRDSTRSPDQTIWMRSNYNRAQSDILNGKQEVTIKTGLLQIGADLIQQDNLVAGVYAGYGHSDIDNKSRQTGTSADGKVNGYQVGVYGSWLPDNNVGLFADVWAYYAWYDNKLSGAAQYSTTKYDSTGYALSGEIGYGFELSQQENGRSWILEPHAQLIYTHVDADDFYDSLGTWYSSNKGSGIQTRLGARLYGQNAPGQHGVNPFIEANWLHNNLDSGVSLNGYQVSSDIGKNVGEVKIGLQGQVTDRLSVWGHVGAQRGSESFERYEFQLGLGWQW